MPELTKSYLDVPELYPEKYGSLVLSFQSLSVEIYKLFQKPRKNIIGIATEYSFAGTPLLRRNRSISKMEWDVSCLLDINSYDLFMAIVILHDTFVDENVDAPPEEYSIIIDDYLNPVIEKGNSPTRAFADGASDVKALSDEAIRYFGRFYSSVNLSSITQNRKGAWWEISFKASETILYPA